MNQKYAEYLQTDYWKQAAAAVKAKAGYRCQVCNSPESLEAHHRTYKYLFNDQDHLDELICLCHNCHSHHHNKGTTSFEPARKPFKHDKKRLIRQSITGQVGAAYSAAKQARMEGLDRSRFLFFVRGALHRGWDNSRILSLAKTKSWPAFKSIVACDPELV